MQRHWECDDLVEHFTLLPHEYALIATMHAPHNRLGFAVLLKFFLYAGHFPQHRHAVPLSIVEHLAAQARSLGILKRKRCSPKDAFLADLTNHGIP